MTFPYTLSRPVPPSSPSSLLSVCLTTLARNGWTKGLIVQTRMDPLVWVARGRCVGQGMPPTLDEVPPSVDEETWFTETQRVQRMASCFLKFRKVAVKATNKIKNTSYETSNKHDKLCLLHLSERIWRNNRKQNGIITMLHAVR